MKKLLAIVLIVTLLASFAGMAGVALAGNNGNGNGAPSGRHYNLNIIGMEHPKDIDNCGNGHRIFVQMDKNMAKRTKINLIQADPAIPEEQAFKVIDCDGTDGTASFQLPVADPDNTGTTRYSVFIRLRGNPGGKVKMTTCAWDPILEEEVCSDLQVIEVRETGKGKNKFNNVSAELLYIYTWIWNETEETWEYLRVPLFDDRLQDYLWYYDNNGCRLAQLRFYPYEETDVPDPQDIPHLLDIDPGSGKQCDTGLAVTITGSTSLPGGPDVDFTGVQKKDVDFGSGITVDAVSVDSANSNIMIVTIDIDCAAEIGIRFVSVTLADDRTLSIPFEVLEYVT